MPLVKEMRHVRSLNFQNERKVIILRGQGYSFPYIAKRVRNLLKKRPPVRTVADVYYAFNQKVGVRKFHYNKSGRKAYKLTKEMQLFLIRRLLYLRKRM